MRFSTDRNKHREYSFRETCPESGAQVIQLSSAAYIHMHVYPESPVFTPDSRRFIYDRFHSLDGPNQYWVCDLSALSLVPLTEPATLSSPSVTPDGRFMVYIVVRGERELEVHRVSLETRTDESIALVSGHGKPYHLSTVSPDGRYFVTGVWAKSGLWGLLRVDLTTGEHGIIHEAKDIFNPHMQFEPGEGQDILVQHNRGGKLDERGMIVNLVGEEGATFYLIDREGGNLRTLDIGKPYSPPCQGHQCWIGTTKRILSTIHLTHEEAMTAGNLVSIAEGEKGPTVVAKGHFFSHPNASRDGRFWVSDVLPGGDIHIGSIRTGHHRLLCRSGSSFGSPQYTHPHPCFSPDARTVLFNSDRTGLAQIHAARVPDGLLDELDA